MELESILSELRQELPQPIRVRALPRHEPQPQPINVTVNPPNITMPSINVSSPIQERSKSEDEMQIIINNPQSETAEILKTLADSVLEIKAAQPTPVVNVTVSPTPVEIVNENTVEVSPTPIEVTVPTQQAPVVNVAVSPTPVTVENTVVLPEQKPANKTITIVKDGNVWHGESKENTGVE
jgi:hypothetical protein